MMMGRWSSSHNNTARFPGNWILPVVMGSTVSNAVRQHLPALPLPHLTNAKSSTYISCISATSRKCIICNYLNIDHPGLTSSHKCEIFCYFKTIHFYSIATAHKCEIFNEQYVSSISATSQRLKICTHFNIYHPCDIL